MIGNLGEKSKEKGIEPDAGRGHYWPQDVADAKKVYALESGGSCGDVEVKHCHFLKKGAQIVHFAQYLS